MREPSLKDTTIISLCIHILLFGITLISIKKSANLTLPEPYTVRLVSPSQVGAASRSVSRIKAIKAERRKKLLKKKHLPPVPEEKKKVVKSVVPENKTGISVEEKINLIKAKKRIEKIVKLRKAVLSVKPGNDTEAQKGELPKDNTAGGQNPEGGLLAGYHALVREKIWGEWVYPSVREEGELECIVTVRINKDGSIRVVGVEKGSGNRLFDRSALRAIEKASPLPPPPYEMTVDLRFTP